MLVSTNTIWQLPNLIRSITLLYVLKSPNFVSYRQSMGRSHVCERVHKAVSVDIICCVFNAFSSIISTNIVLQQLNLIMTFDLVNTFTFANFVSYRPSLWYSHNIICEHVYWAVYNKYYAKVFVCLLNSFVAHFHKHYLTTTKLDHELCFSTHNILWYSNIQVL